MKNQIRTGGMCKMADKNPKRSGSNMHFVYILKCSDGTLYTGYTTDVCHRLSAHNSGQGAKYTRGRGPCELVYVEEFDRKEDAMKREWQIKHKYTKKQKEELIISSANNLADYLQ